MLRKDNRIHLKKQYAAIFSSGKKFVSHHLVVYILTNEIKQNRYGIIASKKVGKANCRNLAKRRMRHVARATLTETRSGYDFIIVCRSNIRTASFHGLHQEFTGIIKKAGLYVKIIGN